MIEKWQEFKKDMYKPSSYSFSIFVTILCLIAIALFVGLYPGRLVTDTAVNIYHALVGTYSLRFPPFVEAFLGMLFVFDKSLFSLFFLQIFTYWFGVFLLVRYFYKNSIFLSFLTICVALFPYNIYLHSTLIKDVWLQGGYIVFFGLISLAAHKDKVNATLVFIILFYALIVILLRNAFIPIIIPLSTAIAFVMLKASKKVLSLKYFLHLIGSSIIICLMLWIVASTFNSVVTSGSAKTNSYYFGRLATYDLLGMSIRSEHSSVTSKLSPSAKDQISQAYFGMNLMWGNRLGKEATDLKNQLTRRPSTITVWLDFIKSNPTIYIQHRWHVFSKHFDGTGQPHASTLSRSLSLGPKAVHHELEKLNISRIQPTPIWVIYTKYIKGYFSILPATWWILFLSISMLVTGAIYTIKTKIYNRDLFICGLMNFAAWSYFGPYIFMLNHTEVRYVYPGLSLILFSSLFFLSFLIKALKKGGAELQDLSL